MTIAVVQATFSRGSSTTCAVTGFQHGGLDQGFSYIFILRPHFRKVFFPCDRLTDSLD